MKNFWTKLPEPFLALAPMDDVTDTTFRQVVASVGKPDVFFTEFVSVEGLCSRGEERLKPKLQFTKGERPLVAQIWGTKPENFFKTAQMISEMGFDGVDINMGCPDKKVVKVGGGGSTIKDSALAAEIITATKEGAKGLPVSVKTRIGFREIVTEEWIGFLLKQNLEALTVHGRTVAELSLVPAHWDEIGKAVHLRNELGVKTKIIGNGDVKSYQEAYEKYERYGVDGIMIGRGIFENLWIFNPKTDIAQITPEQRIKVLLEHARLFESIWGKSKNFNILKKFFKAYIRDFEGASELRSQLMVTRNAKEVEEIFSRGE